MRVKVMTPIYRGKRTVDLDFVDFCQFQNVFKGEGRFFKVFPELWDFALTTSDHLYPGFFFRRLASNSNPIFGLTQGPKFSNSAHFILTH